METNIQKYVGGDRHLLQREDAEGIVAASLSATVGEWIRAPRAVQHPVCDGSGMALSSSPYQQGTEGHLMTAWLADNSYQPVRQSKYRNGVYRAADYVRKGWSEGNGKN